jgi:hypothetical protein
LALAIAENRWNFSAKRELAQVGPRQVRRLLDKCDWGAVAASGDVFVDPLMDCPDCLELPVFELAGADAASRSAARINAAYVTPQNRCRIRAKRK